MAIFYMLVGLPGSGKSTYAKEFEQKHGNITVFSSDALRKQLYGDESVQANPKIIFDILKKEVKKCLLGGKDALLDATSIRDSERKSFLSTVPKDARKVCVFIDAPVALCLEQNQKRERHIPENVIIRMSQQLVPPNKDEGWDEIVTINKKANIRR